MPNMLCGEQDWELGNLSDAISVSFWILLSTSSPEILELVMEVVPLCMNKYSLITDQYS